jgi:predicted GTPase
MSRWRVLLVASLEVLPFAALAGVGTYYLWMHGWWFGLWWLMLASMGLGLGLAWYWQHKNRLLRPPEPEPPMHWTERDARAWELVQARARAAVELPADQLTEPRFYLDTGQQMAQELAAYYHPGASDPVGNLTVPEILAVVELASHDLGELVDHYLPGGHLLTVNDWRRAQKAVGWYDTGSKVYWAVAALFAPVETGLRFAASKLGVSEPLQALQNNLLVWFYTAFIHRMGTYLIELHSGRLRIGATRYRSLLEAARRGVSRAGTDEKQAEEAVEEVRSLTVTLMGQVKAGKSSLVNALLGEQRARTDVLPATRGVDRYELRSPGVPTRLTLLDTVGYGHAGPRADQTAITAEAAQQSDLLLLVLHARNPARQADLEALEQLVGWFASHPDLKRPPIVAVLTHIDLLSPAMEWSPPYRFPVSESGPAPSAKERNIQDAVATAREQLSGMLADVVPVCAAEGKVFGVEEWLLPAIVRRLDEVHAVALLRCLKAEADMGKVRKFFRQLLAAGKSLARAAFSGRKGSDQG